MPQLCWANQPFSKHTLSFLSLFLQPEMPSLLFPYQPWPLLKGFFIFNSSFLYSDYQVFPVICPLRCFSSSYQSAICLHNFFLMKTYNYWDPVEQMLHPWCIIHQIISLGEEIVLITSSKSPVYNRVISLQTGSDLYKLTEFISTGRPYPVSVLQIKQRRDSSIPQGADNLVMISDI